MNTYRGPDRRAARVTASDLGVPYRATAAALVALAALALTHRGEGATGDGLDVDHLLVIATTSLSLLAGCLQLERWRVSGLTAALWTAAGGFLATGMVVGARLLPALIGNTDPAMVGAFSLACTAVLVVVTLWVALGPDIDLRVRPRTVILAIAGLLVTAMPAFHALGLGLRTDAHPAPGPVGRFVLAGAWLVAGVVLTARSRNGGPVTKAYLALFSFAIAAGSALIGLQMGDGIATNPARSAMFTLGALALVYASERDLRTALASQASELDQTRARVHAVDDLQRHAHAAAAERAHEARNALAAIDGAIRTLEKYRDKLSDDTRHQLSSGMTTELLRLQRLVDVEDKTEAPTVFRVAELLTPVVLLARTQGLEVETDIRPDVEVHAARDATIEVVQNLLLNAQRHAGGLGVVLQVGTDGERAIIRVLDRGPGVPPDERDAVFRRGKPQGGAGGRGFGLYLSRRLVDAQGGTLAVRDRPGGGASFEFDLPLAPSCRRMWTPLVDQREHLCHAEEAGSR